MRRTRHKFLFFLSLSLLVLTGCVGRPTGLAFDFHPPVEHRLILQVPFFPDDSKCGGPAALASLMTYNGRPASAADLGPKLPDEKSLTGPDLVIAARREGLTASFFNGSPDRLVQFVITHQPVILRLKQGVGPVPAGNFLVVVGFGPDGLVVNSGSIQQQILPWSNFLTSWLKENNLTIQISPQGTPLAQ